MPSRLPDKPRAQTISADHRRVHDEHDDPQGRIEAAPKPRTTAPSDTLENVDWLALFGLALAVSAMFIAALAYFGEGDATGAAAVLGGAACIIAIALFVSKAPADRA